MLQISHSHKVKTLYLTANVPQHFSLSGEVRPSSSPGPTLEPHLYTSTTLQSVPLDQLHRVKAINSLDFFVNQELEQSRPVLSFIPTAKCFPNGSFPFLRMRMILQCMRAHEKERSFFILMRVLLILSMRENSYFTHQLLK